MRFGSMSDLENVIQILAATLQLGERAEVMNSSTPLLGSIAEFDSMAVVTVLTAVEEQYGFEIEDDEISADVFETVGSLASFIAAKNA